MRRRPCLSSALLCVLCALSVPSLRLLRCLLSTEGGREGGSPVAAAAPVFSAPMCSSYACSKLGGGKSGRGSVSCCLQFLCRAPSTGEGERARREDGGGLYWDRSCGTRVACRVDLRLQASMYWAFPTQRPSLLSSGRGARGPLADLCVTACCLAARWRRRLRRRHERSRS